MEMKGPKCGVPDGTEQVQPKNADEDNEKFQKSPFGNGEQQVFAADGLYLRDGKHEMDGFSRL